MKRNIYIVVTHIASASKAEKGKWEVTENCEFVDVIKHKHLTEASVIINYTERKLEKDRNKEGTLEQYLEYIESNYPDQMKELKEKFNLDT